MASKKIIAYLKHSQKKLEAKESPAHERREHKAASALKRKTSR